MTMQKLLIANRGEIALRIARTAADLGLECVAIAPRDDCESLHIRRATQHIELPGAGAAAYLNGDAVIKAAIDSGADAIHPGYGFLAENAGFAAAVEQAGLTFVGPTPETLALFGDKLTAKARAADLGVPCLTGSTNATLADASAFFASLPPGTAMLIKAVAGGGGRGMRVVHDAATLPDAYARCQSEAAAAFGDASVYVERFLPDARHIEVQILGDGAGRCIALGERECTLQRRHQKLVEIAPSPSLTAPQRDTLTGHALTLANSAAYRSLGTFEFLFCDNEPDGENMFFIEANPRIQVEHTVTEEVFSQDLVALQLRLSMGQSMAQILPQTPMPQGHAVQIRINMETMDATAQATPAGGQIGIYEPPSGAGIRVDGMGYAGYRTSPRYDSLLAKLITYNRHGTYGATMAKAARALGEFRVTGVDTNIAWLRALLARPELASNTIDTRFVETHAGAIFDAMQPDADGTDTASDTPADAAAQAVIPAGSTAVAMPMQATVVSALTTGDTVTKGAQIAVIEAMKMEHVITAPLSGTVTAHFATTGDTLMQNAPILAIEPGDTATTASENSADINLDYIRPDLAELSTRRAFTLDENRPQAVEKRHKRGQQTARENLDQVCDAGSFVEYGAFAVAAQRQRRSMDDLVENTSGDGMLTGLGTVNADQFADARCAFAIGDYTVLAGTQGQRHHRKLDRILHTAGDWNIPLVFFAEGGGGRPGDTEKSTYSGVANRTFAQFASLSGQVPMVGVVSGRCFAGNAALLGCCDVIIATESSNIGMAGPAMIEGGGLGIYTPEQIGPIDSQSANGVVDIRVRNEAEACAIARKYLSYFQGDTTGWQAPDPRELRHVVPENRLRVYDMRRALHGIADKDSTLELRAEFGLGILTAFIRIEGKPFGVIANNPRHLGGAIDAPAADKASRFMQLCDAFDIPLISLCDSPGFMVGPEAEKTALVRHACRMFVTARSLTVPLFGVVLRKCYGLGAMGMIGGGTYNNAFTVAWPTGEFGPMGLEGAVTLGYRRELDAISDPVAKKALYDRLLGEYYQQGKAISVAQTLEIDAVIDPVDTRKWVLAGLRSTTPQGSAPATGGKGPQATGGKRPQGTGGKRPMVDPW